MERMGALMESLISPSSSSSSSSSSGSRGLTLDICYITQNIIAMSMPDTTRNNSAALKEYLDSEHRDKYLIVNISDETYDYSIFDDCVVAFSYRGFSFPPLSQALMILSSISNWLDASPDNIVAIHCITGGGRTTSVIACLLVWLKEFDTVSQALDYISVRRGASASRVMVPSQARYLEYFQNLLDGFVPPQQPLLLRRLIITGMPFLGDSGSNRNIRPYVQLFNSKGVLLATSVLVSQRQQLSGGSGSSRALQVGEMGWADRAEDVLHFRVDCPLSGDVLIRCRHLRVDGTAESIFRLVINIDFIACKDGGAVARFRRAQLDNISNDPLFRDSFFVDLFFAPVSSRSKREDARGVPVVDALTIVPLSPPSKRGTSTAPSPPLVVAREISVMSDHGLLLDTSAKVSYRDNLGSESESGSDLLLELLPKIKKVYRLPRKFKIGNKQKLEDKFIISDTPGRHDGIRYFSNCVEGATTEESPLEEVSRDLNGLLLSVGQGEDIDPDEYNSAFFYGSGGGDEILSLLSSYAEDMSDDGAAKGAAEAVSCEDLAALLSEYIVLGGGECSAGTNDSDKKPL